MKRKAPLGAPENESAAAVPPASVINSDTVTATKREAPARSRSLAPSLPPGYLPPSMHARERMRVAGGEESESTLSAKFYDGHCELRRQRGISKVTYTPGFGDMVHGFVLVKLTI